jgi:lysozyme
MNVFELLLIEEGFKKNAYYCTEGYPTIGIGWKIGLKGQPLEDFQCITLTEEVAKVALSEEVKRIESQIQTRLECYSNLSKPRKAILISMAYQLGVTGLFKFKRMIAAIEKGDFKAAYSEGLDSRWRKQTPQRAQRHMMTMLYGSWSEYK